MQNEKALKFITKANAKHENFYDYSKVVYVNAKINTTIICPIHGEFSQTPDTHLRSGCNDCGNDKMAEKQRLVAESRFFKRAPIIHNNKYDYSKVVYQKNNTDVIIVCHIHGEFSQRPANHLSGSGCNGCGVERASEKRRLVSETKFFKQAPIIHNNKYDYSKVKYVGADKKVIIVCPIHGEFEQIPASHLNGCGCEDCAKLWGLERIKDSALTIDEFVDRAKIKHGDFYDYSLAEYMSQTNEIKIICPVHGEFHQIAGNHLSGKGCNGCGNDKMAEKQRLVAESRFFKQAPIIHNNKYDYSKAKYIKAKTGIIIVCPIHGEFSQSPDVHLRGNGCQRCRETKGEKVISGYLEMNNIEFETEIFSKDLFEKSLFLKEHRLTRFDFVLSLHNLIIEFDGIGHFKPIAFGGNVNTAKKLFQKRVDKDKAKNALVGSSKYNLLRIPYWEMDNIEDILQEVIYGDRALMLNTYSHQANMDMFESGVLPTDKNLRYYVANAQDLSPKIS